MPKFALNEYVWDRTREGPGMVVGYDERLELPYTVAEINDQRKLGRIGFRSDATLCRYVRVLLPEDEAVAVVMANEVVAVDSLDGAATRVEDALKRRGIELEDWTR